MAIEFKGSHFERDVILWGVRWYVVYPISYRQIHEMMEDHGVDVDHSTLNHFFRARYEPDGQHFTFAEALGPPPENRANQTNCMSPPGIVMTYVADDENTALADTANGPGVRVDHSTLNRWVLKYAPLLQHEFRACKCPVGRSWRMDETYVRVKGVWKYLYRAVDKAGATVDFLLTAKRDRNAALRFLLKAFGQHGTPEKITIDKSGANTVAIDSYNVEHKASIEIRQVEYLNNIVAQDHRVINRLVRPMLGFKSLRSAAATLAGIELMHMIRKGQLRTTGELRPAQQFDSLAG